MLPFTGYSVIAQLLYTVAQIAGAHDGNIRKSFERTEGLCLECADKRDSDIDYPVCSACRQKKADGQEQDFHGQYNVPPFNKSIITDMALYDLCEKHP